MSNRTSKIDFAQADRAVCKVQAQVYTQRSLLRRAVRVMNDNNREFVAYFLRFLSRIAFARKAKKVGDVREPRSDSCMELVFLEVR